MHNKCKVFGISRVFHFLVHFISSCHGLGRDQKYKVRVFQVYLYTVNLNYFSYPSLRSPLSLLSRFYGQWPLPSHQQLTTPPRLCHGSTLYIYLQLRVAHSLIVIVIESRPDIRLWFKSVDVIKQQNAGSQPGADQGCLGGAKGEGTNVIWADSR